MKKIVDEKINVRYTLKDVPTILTKAVYFMSMQTSSVSTHFLSEVHRLTEIQDGNGPAILVFKVFSGSILKIVVMACALFETIARLILLFPRVLFKALLARETVSAAKAAMDAFRSLFRMRTPSSSLQTLHKLKSKISVFAILTAKVIGCAVPAAFVSYWLFKYKMDPTPPFSLNIKKLIHIVSSVHTAHPILTTLGWSNVYLCCCLIVWSSCGLGDRYESFKEEYCCCC